MKTIKYLFITMATVTLLLCNGAFLNAQVTIGGSAAPKKGSVLDLNATFKGGLLLPNVEITDLGKIPATFSDVSVQNADIVPSLTGLTVYNSLTSVADNIFRGIYFWNGDNWQMLAIDEGTMSIPADSPGYANNNPLSSDNSAATGAIQIINPSLTITGQYSFVVISGGEFSFVTPINLEQGIFSVEFQPNPTAFMRRCVIMVTDPIGKTATFMFTQDGSECHTNVDLTAAAYGSAVLCNGGAVHAYVASVSANTVADYGYFWLRNGVLVAQGAGVELTQAGNYVVYADKIGCGTPGTVSITESSDNTAARPPYIIADNNGILCGTNGVTLSALNAPSPATGIMWMKDGIKQGENTSSFYVTADEVNQGTWYLVYNDGGSCSSVSSNKINIAYNGSAASNLPAPDAMVNGVSISVGSLTVCAGGTLELTVANTTDYNGFNNVEYEWFGNGRSLGKTTAATMYVVPPSYADLVLSITVTASGQCPMSVTSNDFTVITGSTPYATSINRGDVKAYICASNPAILTADATTGSTYQWFRNGSEAAITMTNVLSVTKPGSYTVRYANAVGCWSMVSSPIEVIQSAPVSISWTAPPAAEEIFGSSKTYSIVAAPDADVIEWIESNTSIATIIKLGNGNAATVIYGDTETTDFQIKVIATNACGASELLSDMIHVKSGCIPAGSVVITPSSTQTIEMGQSISYTASANIGTAPINYKWFVDGIEQTGMGTNGTFTFTPPAAKSAPGYAIAAQATADCAPSQESASPTAQLIVTINPKLLPDPPSDLKTAFSGGKSCLDVHATDGNATDNPWADGGRLPLSIRPNDFNNGSNLAFNYNFGGSNAVSNIRFIISDPQNIIQSVSGDANASSATATVTVKPNTYTSAIGTTKTTALSAILYAVFDANGQTYKDSIVIKIQDQACGCPAKVTATTWQMFQCHSVGANTNADPFDISNPVALRGNYYVWGRKLPTKDRNNNVASPQPATTRPSETNWTAWESPCEYGWFVPPRTTWQGVYNNNTRTRTNTFLQFGTYLILPAQGYYVGSATSFSQGTGAVVVPNELHNWTGSANAVGSTTGHNFYAAGSTATAATWGDVEKNYQEPVRCIQEGNPY